MLGVAQPFGLATPPFIIEPKISRPGFTRTGDLRPSKNYAFYQNNRVAGEHEGVKTRLVFQ